MVGAGVIGLLTAVDAVRAGHEVIVVDRGDIPNPRAASFDRHRVIRALHVDDPATTAAALAAHRHWVQLQDWLRVPFYVQVGGLTVLAPADLERAHTTVTSAGGPARALDPDELAAAFPHVRFPAGAGGLLESRAGVLLADQVLHACADWLRRHPRATLRPHRRAVGVDGSAVHFAGGDIVGADAVLVAMGPWSRDLLGPDVADDLVLYRQTMLYCDAALAGPGWSSTPPMLRLGTDGGAWFVPPVADTPLKLSAASACRTVAEVAEESTPPQWRDHLIDVFSGVIPQFRADWVVQARDAYYLGPASTQAPTLAVLGPAALSFAACGGSSFKFAPLIARSLVGRLSGVDPAPTGLDPFDRAVACSLSEVRPAMRGVT